MQVFQPSSVLSVVMGQASRKYRALRRDWLSVLSLMWMLNHPQVSCPVYTSTWCRAVKHLFPFIFNGRKAVRSREGGGSLGGTNVVWERVKSSTFPNFMQITSGDRWAMTNHIESFP